MDKWSVVFVCCFVFLFSVIEAHEDNDDCDCDARPRCASPLEFYSCGNFCDKECATLGEYCPIVNIRCNDRCYCKEGYARDYEYNCVPINKCPPKTGVWSFQRDGGFKK